MKKCYWPLFFWFAIYLSFSDAAHASEFEIDEIISAIKNEIKTADISELGLPRFSIETVDVALTVFSTETEKGALAVRVGGFSSALDDILTPPKSYQNLIFSFHPSEADDASPDLSLGLVEPILKVKSSLKKACNTPPSFPMDNFEFKLEFALERNLEGGIRFVILDLEDLKAQHIVTHRITIHLKIAS
ncbi:MAG: hypothetical protein KFF68_07485 [Desulfosarcina sp.]|nr:hypothetical protein [Desulfosarcina sp.]